MEYHPRPNDKGLAVPIKHPHSATEPETWADGQQIATVVPDGLIPGSLHYLPFRPWSEAPSDRIRWAESIPTAEIEEPAFKPLKGKDPAAGVVVVEPDGRVWLVSPTGEHGGYKNTFPKGHQSTGLTLQQSAVKEAYEEAGLRVLITAHLVDVERTTTYTRYYLAQRVGGHPGCMGWESQAVHLVPQDRLTSMLNSPYDQPIQQALGNFSARQRWSDFVLDWNGVARRLCFTIQGFALTHGQWPNRLLIDPEAWHYLEQALTQSGLQRVTSKLRPELQLRPKLAVADSEGRLFDYDDEDAVFHPSSYSTDPASTWLWGVIHSNTFA